MIICNIIFFIPAFIIALFSSSLSSPCLSNSRFLLLLFLLHLTLSSASYCMHSSPLRPHFLFCEPVRHFVFPFFYPRLNPIHPSKENPSQENIQGTDMPAASAGNTLRKPLTDPALNKVPRGQLVGIWRRLGSVNSQTIYLLYPFYPHLLLRIDSWKYISVILSLISLFEPNLCSSQLHKRDSFLN